MKRIILISFSLFFLLFFVLIKTHAQASGASCTDAITAVAGTNQANNSSGDQWFKYTATKNGKITITTCGLTSEDTYLRVYSDCSDASIASSDDDCSSQSIVVFPSQEGVTYYIVWQDNYTSGTYNWTLAEEDLMPGDLCVNAISAISGTNQADNSHGDQWFKYTATKDGKIVISSCGLTSEDTYVQIYQDCQGWLLTSNNDFCSKQSEVSFQSRAGVTYYIKWNSLYTSGAYNWTLAEVDPLPGEYCISALNAVADTNEANNSNGHQWFKYTATRDGKIVITTCGLTTENTSLSVYSSCQGYWVAGNDDYCNNQSQVSFQSRAGETYYISWNSWYTSGKYKWILREEEPLPGEYCISAIDAVADTNEADNSNGDQWFKYTATRDGKIVITTCGLTTENTSLSVYSSCQGYWVAGNDDYCNNQSQVSFQSRAGETYYILWQSWSTSGKYKWILREEEPKPGDYCITAIDAVVDTNETDNSNGDQWFKYTATRNGKIIISSCDLTTENTYVSVYNRCNGYIIASNNNFCNLQSKVSFQSIQGETYYIVWRSDYTTGNYKWILKEEDPLPGEFCVTALDAVADTNNADNSNGDQWFKYTATRDGKIVVSSCGLTTENTYFNVYSDCNEGWVATGSDECGTQSKAKFLCNAGETFYIVWRRHSTTGKYKWILKEEDPLPGEFCISALDAVADTNNADNSNGDQWYKYTATRDGKIVISSCDLTTENTYVIVYDNCEGWSLASNNDYCSQQSRVSFQSKAGVTYYIRWLGILTSGEFKWILKEEDPLPGEFCITALNAVAGTNQADNSNGDQWFKYTATRNGKIIVSTCGLTSEDTYVAVYKDCAEWSTVYNDDFCNYQSAVSFQGVAGQMYYIAWCNYNTSATYNWILQEVDALPGEYCVSALDAVAGINHADNSSGDQWFKYTAQVSGKKLVVSSCGLTSEDTYCEIYRDCSGFSETVNNDYCDMQSQASILTEAGVTYYIAWRNYNTSGDYDWELRLEDVQPGEFCGLPLTASVGTNHSIPATNGWLWFEYTAPASGSMVLSAECNDITEYAGIAVFDTCVTLDEMESYVISYLEGFCGESAQLTVNCTQGKIYKILTYQEDGEEFDWNLTFIPDLNNLNEMSAAKGLIKLYPNPNDGRFTLSMTREINNGELYILNISGQVVYTTAVNNAMQELDLSFLNSGLYTVMLRNGKFIWHEKLLINK